MDAVAPRPVGTVTNLIGAPLRADVSLPPGEQLVGYEIELVRGSKGGRAKAWNEPLWRMTSDEPQFVWLDGYRAFEGMRIGRRRPVVRMETSASIDAYSWALHQDGDIIDAASGATNGITADGQRFEFRPRMRLRRSGRPGKARRKAVFYPPFDSHLPGMPRTAASRVRYTALTHDGNAAIAFEYNGPGVEPGEYTFRYRARGDAGTLTPWTYDRSVVVEPAFA